MSQQIDESFDTNFIFCERYQVQERLGGSEVSEVYKVKDIITGRLLVLKVLREGAGADEGLRLSREFYYLSKISHPGIVAVKDFGYTSDRRPYFTSEFIAGVPINRFFTGYKPEFIQVMVQVLWALDAIHSQGLIHCDIKPQHILILEEDGNPKAKLLDLGFAEGLSLSEKRVGKGTLGYVAPEIFKGVDADARADLYALGLVIYETLTGIGPGDGSQLNEWLRRQYYSEFEPPRRFNPAIPEGLERVIMQLINREPERRPGSAQKVIELLKTEIGAEVVVEEQVLPVVRMDLMAPGFVGREDCLAELKAQLQAASESKPGVVCISGERGVGKSRLLSEFKFMAQLEGATIFSFEPVSLGARSQSLLEALVNLLRVYGQNLGKDLTLSEVEAAKFRLFEMIVQRLKWLASSHRVRHSLVVLVDDFELFDPTSLEFLRYLAFSLENERILVVVSGLKEKRFLDIVKELEQKPNCRHIPIPLLEMADVKRLVHSFLGEIDNLDTLTHWLFEITGGNPLWSIETIYALIEKKILIRKGTRWNLAVDDLKSFRPPKTFSDIVRRRLEGLSFEEMEVLEIGAAATGPFTIEFLRAVLNYDDKVLFQTVSRLKALGFLRSFRVFWDEGATTGHLALILASKILETAITERLTIAQHRRNHQRVALALELLYPERTAELVFDLAHHWTQAGVKERAYSYSIRAGAKAREWLLFERALTFYENALAMSVDVIPVRERIKLIETVGELREATGRYSEAIDIYRQGMSVIVADPELTRTKESLVRFLRRLGMVYQKTGATREALDFFNEALMLDPEKNTLESARLLADLGWSYCAAGEYARAEQFLTRALQLTERLKSAHPRDANRLEGLILYYFGVLAWSRFDFVLALQLAEHSLDMYHSLQDDIMIARLNHFLASLWVRRGEKEKAKACYQESLPVQRKSGDVYSLVRTLHGLGFISQEDGELDKAYDYFTEAYSYAERIGDITELVNLGTLLGTVLFDKGDWNNARIYFDKALARYNQAGEQIGVSAGINLLMNLGRLCAKQGEVTESEAFITRGFQLGGNTSNPDSRYYLLIGQAELELRCERFDRARAGLAEAFRLARVLADQRKYGELFLLAANLRLQTGDFQRAEYDAVRALDIFKLSSAALEYAIALRFAGLARCYSGHREKGKTEIKNSIEILRRIGAKYELALSLMASVEALIGRRPGTNDLSGEQRVKPAGTIAGSVPGERLSEEFGEARANLKEALTTFQMLKAKPDAQRASELLEDAERIFGVMQLKVRERSEYLRVFYQLSELINLAIEKEDFLDQVLGLILSVTKAERGVIFLFHRDRLIPAAARDIENTTLVDAEMVSKTVLRKVRRRCEPLISADAISDPKFNSYNSVILNKIRSLLCVPLLIEGRVIGTIYLDSRITTHLFMEEDRNLLLAVANLIAATIERSTAFRRYREEMTSLREDMLIDAASGLFLGRSRSIRQVYQVIDRIAPTDCTVLLTGETGTGKGVLARLIHQRSGRKANKFVAVNCGTLPETLFESELFGHARGSFTGAVKDKVGIFETAHGGTIFLDEITNTTPALQAKLLQVLEEKVIRRVGETEPRIVDVRLICATNKNITQEVAAGRFREDLYYRMNVVIINVPPLRERIGDIPLLADYFLRSYAAQLNKPVLGFEEAVIAAFTTYHWPGNVRELQNTVERAIIMAKNRKISLEDVGSPIADLANSSSDARTSVSNSKRRILGREEVLSALRETRGNISHAAKLLSTHRRQLQRLIKRYQINRDSI